MAIFRGPISAILAAMLLLNTVGCGHARTASGALIPQGGFPSDITTTFKGGLDDGVYTSQFMGSPHIQLYRFWSDGHMIILDPKNPESFSDCQSGYYMESGEGVITMKIFGMVPSGWGIRDAEWMPDDSGKGYTTTLYYGNIFKYEGRAYLNESESSLLIPREPDW